MKVGDVVMLQNMFKSQNTPLVGKLVKIIKVSDIEVQHDGPDRYDWSGYTLSRFITKSCVARYLKKVQSC